MDVKKGKAHEDFEFELYERKVNGELGTFKHKGAWFMVDNGHLSWSCSVPPTTMVKPTRRSDSLSDWNQ